MPPIAERIAADDSVPVLVDFWADWCGLAAWLFLKSRAAAELAGKAIVLKVDAEKYSQIAACYPVRGIPSFIGFAGGRPIMRQAGLVGHDQTEQWLSSASTYAK